MAAPPEFTREAVKAGSPRGELLPSYAFLKSGEPHRSMVANNPQLNVDISEPGRLEYGKGHYYDTTVARKHPYWKDKGLPRPRKDIRGLRADLGEWGYCLIEDALSPRQYAAMKQRLVDQAEGERLAAVGIWVHRANRMVYSLVNKGRCFQGCIEHDPEYVQAGRVMEQLITESLGEGFICNSFQSLIAYRGGTPQMLHQDQGSASPWQTPEAPLLMNSLWLMDDVDERNGGTLVVPGSHRIVAASGSGRGPGRLPPAVNLEGRAGTVMMFDGRLLHGTGVNHTDTPRHVLIMSQIKPWMRSQDLFPIVTSPEVLRSASPKLLHRLGFQAINFGVVEGQGILGSGRPGDPKGSIAEFREAMDAGRYVRVGELSPHDTDALRREYTIRRTDMGRRARRRLEKTRAQL